MMCELDQNILWLPRVAAMQPETPVTYNVVMFLPFPQE
jgi:hypothetical protein